jgi:hypothetical protein
MPLLRNTPQPYFPDPDNPAAIACAGEYCYLAQPGDEIKTQFYQTPCNSNEIADPEFADVTVGSELIVVADANEDPAGSWIWNLFNWAYDPAYVTNTLSWTIALTPGETYLLEFTVAGLQPGNFLDVFLGSTNQTFIVNANDTYSVVLTAGSDNSDLTFSAVSINSIVIAAVSLKLNTFNDWNLNGNWTINDGVACAVGNGTGSLEESVADYIFNGDFGVLTFVVSGRTAGSITPYIADQPASTAITTNGTKTIYKTATADGVIKFARTANFDGCISFPDYRKLKDDYTATLYMGETSFDISSYLEYYEDKVTLNYNPEDDDLPYGCFTIEIIDSCTVQFDEIVANGVFAGGSGINCPDWFKNNDGSMYNFDGSNCKFIRSGALQTNAPILKNTQNFNLVAGNYEIEFEIISNTDTLGIGATVSLDGTFFGAYFTTVGVHTITINGYDPDVPARAPNNLQRVQVIGKFNVDGAPHLGEIVVDNVSVRRIAPFDATYTSECIKYNSEHPNSKLIRAYSDQPSYGFEFENTGFRLQQRMLIRTFNPFQNKVKSISVSGSGNSRLNYAESTKYWRFVTDFLSESAHSALSAQIDMDHFEIGNNITDLVEYTAEVDNYNPDWRDGDYDLAPFSMNIRKKEGGTIFNRHTE